jgi:zinc transport system ATP-binding protein
VLVLDEPTAFLDAKSSAEMYETLKNLNREGLTIIMVSHDFVAAREYASHILYIKTKPLYFGDSGEFFKKDTVNFGGDGNE